MLCKKCEIYRFPSLARSKRSKVDHTLSSNNVPCESQSVPASSKGNNKPVAKPANVNLAKKKKSERATKKAVIDSTVLGTAVSQPKDCTVFATTNTTIGADDTVESQDYCPICNEPVDGCELRCDICKQCIHDHCSGLQR